MAKSTTAISAEKQALNDMQLIIREDHTGSGKLKNKVALITGGDSGIGRSVAVLFAREGADIAIVYNKSDKDAAETKALVEAEHSNCLTIKGDLSDEKFCRKMIRDVHKHFGSLSILVNNAGTHEPDDDFMKVSSRQFHHTFDVNIYPFYYCSQEALKFMEKGSCIINTASVVAFRGSAHLIDYAATKGAVVSFSRALAKNLADKGIRVNVVAPGPVWTPLIYASFSKKHISEFGKSTPMGRAGFAYEIAPAFLFLASADSSFITGQVIHVNGGEIVD